MRKQGPLLNRLLASATVMAMASGLLVIPPFIEAAGAFPPLWVGSVQIFETQLNDDPNHVIEFAATTIYDLSVTATDTSEMTFSASYSHLVEDYTTFPVRALVSRFTAVGVGDGVGGAIDVGYTTAAPAGYLVSGGYNGTAVFPTTFTTEHFLPIPSVGVVTSEIPAQSGGAFIPAPTDDLFVLQGSFEDPARNFCSGDLCVTHTVSFRLRRADCTGALDADGDGLNLCEEFDLGTDPANPDTDGGGVNDGDEVTAGTDPNDMADDFDSDVDGVVDGDDLCPGTPLGVSVDIHGCPIDDIDGDGFPDSQDVCPTVPGIVNGCPDTDGDGIMDLSDACPTLPGPASLNGCPDSDSDGVIDPNDDCPGIPPPGLPADTRGCPLDPDTDGDGVVDSLDPCPTVYGLNNGCPALSGRIKVVVNIDFDALWWDLVPNFLRRGSDLVTIDGSTTATVQGTPSLLAQVAQVCITPQWTLWNDRVNTSVPVDWTDEDGDINGRANHPLWNTPPAQPGGLGSILEAWHPICSDPGDLSVQYTVVKLRGQTNQTETTNFRQLVHQVSVWVVLVDGRVLGPYGPVIETEGASKRPPEIDHLGQNKTLKISIPAISVLRNHLVPQGE